MPNFKSNVRFLNVSSSLALTAILGAAVLFAGADRADAQAWPTRTVKIVTPQPAGTAIDTGLRMIGDRLAKRWGQSVIVENRPGGDGIPATAAFVSARDDHALFGSPGYPFTIAPSMLDKLPYDAQADVTAISLMFETPLMIAVNSKVPVNNLADLEKLARAEPGKLNWASTAGLPNFAMNFFLKTTGGAMAYVPYRDASSALNDVGEGRIEAYATSYGTVLPVVQTGKVKVLAMLGGSRIPLAPDISTSTEQGYPKVRADGFAGLFGIKGMPDAQRDRIAADVKEIAAEKDLQEVMAKSALVARGYPAAEFTPILEGQRALVAEMLGVLGLLKAPAK